MTLERVMRITKEICKEEKMAVPSVSINKSISRTLARAFVVSERYPRGHIQFGKESLQMPEDDLRNLVHHEIIHVKTGLPDESQTFRMICRAKGIRLNGDPNYKSVSYTPHKYELYCGACKQLLAQYQRMAGHLKAIKDNPSSRGCTLCETVGDFQILEINGSESS